MTGNQLLQVVGSVLATFGGGAVIFMALAKWWGDLLAKRVLQNERGKIEERLDALSHELSLARTSYDHYLDLIIDYYAQFWKHFQMCRKVALSEQTRDRVSGVVTDNRDDYLSKIEPALEEWRAYEGRIRLLLPKSILDLHEQSISKFNEFNEAIYEFDISEKEPRKKSVIFGQLSDIKSGIEDGLREYLRTESFIKREDSH